MAFSPTKDALAEQVHEVVLDRLLDRGGACLGQVRLVDQAAERVGDLGGPVLVRVDLPGSGEITQEVRAAQLVQQVSERFGVVVLAP